MANQIRMTPDVMRQRANEYRTQGEAVNEVISKMDQLLGQLQSEWEGNASEAYAARSQDCKDRRRDRQCDRRSVQSISAPFYSGSPGRGNRCCAMKAKTMLDKTGRVGQKCSCPFFCGIFYARRGGKRR